MTPLGRSDTIKPEMTSKMVDQAMNNLAVQEFAAHRFPLLEKEAAARRCAHGQRGEGTLSRAEPDPVEGEERKPHAAKRPPP
jgi:hypothetical protein